jgi:hypothetical protein
VKPTPVSSSPEPFDHASKDGKGESGNREENQRCHRGGDSHVEWAARMMGVPGSLKDAHEIDQPALHDPPIFPEARSAFSSGGRGS